MSRFQRLWTQLWVAPVVGTVVAVVVGGGALGADHLFAWEDVPFLVYRGTADSARTYFSVVATAVTTLLALVFTIIAVVIQLASGQYSPRILGTLVKDRPTHLTIGIFVGTITYALLCLQGIDGARNTAEDEFSSIAVTFGFVLAVVAIGTFAAYSNHIVHAVRVENIIGLASRVTLALVDQVHPEQQPAEPRERERPQLGRPDQIVTADGPGILLGYDVEELVTAAERAGAVIVLVPRVGSFVRTGGPLFEVHGTSEDLDLRRHLHTGAERTTTHDLLYAMRQVVDIAARALSPGDHDPTTAVQALDQVHEILARLATRQISDGVHCGADGQVRLLLEVTSWETYVELAVDEVRQLGSDSPQVTRRLLDLLEDLRDLAPPHRREVVEQQHQLVLDRAGREAANEHDRLNASRGDRQGLGL